MGLRYYISQGGLYQFNPPTILAGSGAKYSHLTSGVCVRVLKSVDIVFSDMHVSIFVII